MSANTTLEPVSNYRGTDGYTPMVPSASQTDSPVTHVITRTLNSSQTATNLELQDMVGSQKFTSGYTIGLAIGLPVGLFFLGLIMFLCLSRLRKKATLTRRRMVGSAPISGDGRSHRGWFTGLTYSCDRREEDIFAPEKRLPLADSSTIQYRVSKSNPHHILTPKAPVCRDGSTTLEGMSVRNDVDTLLYTKPPNIYHIRSEVPSTNTLPTDTPSLSSSSPNNRPRPPNLDLPLHKWRYESPLSSWFLRNSTYLGDEEEQINGNGTIVTPTVQLKQLKILSRINKNYADESQLMENEKSPILEKTMYEDESEDEPELCAPSGIQVARKPSLVVYGTVNSGTTISHPFSNSKIKVKRQRKERRQSKLGHHLQEVSEHKPLPLTPKKVSVKAKSEKLEVGHVYRVIQEYRGCLADEIDIAVGEFVLILATHTDGWCLVEKCTEEGTSKSLMKTDERSLVDANDKNYLNNDRGIVPGDCLDEL